MVSTKKLCKGDYSHGYCSTIRRLCPAKNKYFKGAKNEKVNSTHRPPSRFYFCTVDIFSFTPLMVCLELLLTAMEGVYYE